MFIKNVHSKKVNKKVGKQMKTGNKNQKILREALARFEEVTRITAAGDLKADLQGPDAIIRINWQNMKWNFAAEIKPVFTRAMIGGTIQQMMRLFPEKGLLITTYITPQIADTLKEFGIQFIDTVGNAYINEPPLLVFIKGNRPAEMHRGKLTTRAFRPTGLQVVFALLCNPGLEKAAFREIAKVADVALGTVGWVMGDLREIGHLADMGKRGRLLVLKEKLLRRWVTAYPEQLRPKKLLGRYKASDPDWWKNAELPPLQVYWGGETAATRLIRYLKPQVATIYTQNLGPLTKWLAKNRLKKHPNGDIEILRKFWKFDHVWRYEGLVHPLLIYADLLATGDPRNIETAEIIYEKELARLITED